MNSPEMLYWKRRDKKVPLDEIASAENNGGTGVSAIDLTIDAKYNPTSPNPQAGTAVAQAMTTVESTLNTKYSEVMRYKGSVANYNSLPKSGQVKGDVYNVNDTGANYAWNGSAWDKLNENLDGYVTSTQLTTLQNSFTTHKNNQDTNIKHLTDALYKKVEGMEVFTQDDVKKRVQEALDGQLTLQGVITPSYLEERLKQLQNTVQTNVTNTIQQTLSATYTSKADFNTFKTQNTNDLALFIKCDEAKTLKIYAGSSASSATPLLQRDSKTLYICGAY